MQLALSLWVAGLSLLLQIGDCSTPLCVQGKTVANQAVSFSQELLKNSGNATLPSVSNTFNTSNTPRVTVITDSVMTQTPQTTTQQIAQSVPVVPVVPLVFTAYPTYSVLNYVPSKRADANDDGIEDINGAIIQDAKTTYNVHFELNKPGSGTIDVYSGGNKVNSLTYTFSDMSVVDYQVVNIWGMQMSYSVIVNGLSTPTPANRLNMQPSGL
jgi:hypothetical protein